MLLEMDHESKLLKPLEYVNIQDALGENETQLESALVKAIGNTVFPQYLVFGTERSFQKEADIFAVDENGNLVVIELKVAGHYDRNKIYQAFDYAQSFSHWQYEDMETHFMKCFPNQKQHLSDAFREHFGFDLDPAKFNNHQRIVVISNSSSERTSSIASYWKQKGIDIEEYFYRFYRIDERLLFELSTELYVPNVAYHCWINTCERYIPGAYWDMVKNKKAATYGDRVQLIGEWFKGAYIFLYLNGYGIVGAGIGTARIVEDTVKEEKSILLKDFIHGVNLDSGEIENHLPASRIKEILDQDFYFPNSIVPLYEKDAKAIYKECQRLFKKAL